MTQQRKEAALHQSVLVTSPFTRLESSLTTFSLTPYSHTWPPPQIPIIFQNATKCFARSFDHVRHAPFAESEEQIINTQKWTKLPGQQILLCSV